MKISWLITKSNYCGTSCIMLWLKKKKPKRHRRTWLPGRYWRNRRTALPKASECCDCTPNIPVRILHSPSYLPLIILVLYNYHWTPLSRCLIISINQNESRVNKNQERKWINPKRVTLSCRIIIFCFVFVSRLLQSSSIVIARISQAYNSRGCLPEAI